MLTPRTANRQWTRPSCYTRLCLFCVISEVFGQDVIGIDEVIGVRCDWDLSYGGRNYRNDGRALNECEPHIEHACMKELETMVVWRRILAVSFNTVTNGLEEGMPRLIELQGCKAHKSNLVSTCCRLQNACLWLYLVTDCDGDLLYIGSVKLRHSNMSRSFSFPVSILLLLILIFVAFI